MNPRVRSILLSTVALACILAAVVGPGAANAATPCWQRVIADWADNGTVDGSYSASCYRAAMANAPTDLRIYSTIEDDLRFALQSRTMRRISVDTVHRPVGQPAAVLPDRSSTSPMVVALGAGLGLIGVAVSAAVVVRRRKT